MTGDLVLKIAIGGHHAAIAAADVQSVIELGDITPVPATPPHIAGLTALRSQALTVIDCSAALGLDAPPQTTPGANDTRQAAVIELEGHFYALIVDLADDVTPCLSDIRPVAGKMGAAWGQVAHGMIETAQGATLLINPAAFIRGDFAQAA